MEPWSSHVGGSSAGLTACPMQDHPEPKVEAA